MNKRIKELAEQCWVRVPYYPAGNDGHPEYNTVFSQEKFAELIVKECAGIDFRHKIGLSSDQDYEVSNTIKQHFGVEE